MSMGPSPPDVGAVQNESVGLSGEQIAQNTAAAEQQQVGSNYNQFGPYGSLQYTQTGTGPNGTPIYSSTTSLSPQQQNLLNLLQGSQATAGSQAGSLLAEAGYGAAAPSDVIGNLTSGLTGQNMQAYLAASDPFFATQSQQLDTQLRNQGLAPGDAAYDNAMRSLTTNQGYSVEGAAASFEPQAFQQATTEYTLPEQLALQLGGYGAPANPTSTLQGGAGLNIQIPNQAADASAMTTAAQNQYQAQQNQFNSMINGMMSIGTGLFAA